MNKKIKMIVLATIAAVAMISCQSNEEVLAPQDEQAFEFPTRIEIVADGGVVTKAGATPVGSVNEVAGRYTGKLSEVYMNENKKDDPVQDIFIDIIPMGNNTFQFVLNPFQVGKMPGYLTVNIKGLILDSNGKFYADGDEDFDILDNTLSIKFLKPKDPKKTTGWFNVTFIEGDFTKDSTGTHISFKLESNGMIMNAKVKYKGIK